MFTIVFITNDDISVIIWVKRVYEVQNILEFSISTFCLNVIMCSSRRWTPQAGDKMIWQVNSMQASNSRWVYFQSPVWNSGISLFLSKAFGLVSILRSGFETGTATLPLGPLQYSFLLTELLLIGFLFGYLANSSSVMKLLFYLSWNWSWCVDFLMGQFGFTWACFGCNWPSLCKVRYTAPWV